MIQNTMKLTSKGVEFIFPVEVDNAIKYYTLEEISQQLYDSMSYDRKGEWYEEEYAVITIPEGHIIEVTVDFPNNFDGTNIMQINVRTGCVESLEDLKALIIAVDNLAATFKPDDIDDEEDCSCSCC